tara:strand:+ start:689 stop:1165 length:477 start_codon:yes stop_codon:yes gene_type:complete
MRDLLQQIIDDPQFAEGQDWSRLQCEVNQVLVKIDEPADKLYFIESGRVKVSGSVALESERKIQPGLCELEAGDVFGELALFVDTSRSATVSVVEAGSVIEINCAALRTYLDQHPELGYQLLKTMFQTLSARLVKSNHKVQNLLAWGLKAHNIDSELG